MSRSWSNISVRLLAVLWLALGVVADASAVGHGMRKELLSMREVVMLDTLEINDSIVRVLARRIGMVDTSEISRLPMNEIEPTSTRGEMRREKIRQGWARLVPNQFTCQYAGSIGVVSAGIGWHYGKKAHWETDLLIGAVPRYHTGRVRVTFTVKQRYVPWHCRVGGRFVLQPLTAGAFLSTISGDDFWNHQPDRYPDNYYFFSTKVRAHVYAGQRICYRIPESRQLLHSSISLYYELSACDIYIMSKAVNKSYPWSKTLSLAFGLRFVL